MANETAKTTVYLDGKQAEAAIESLKTKSKELKVQLEAAKKAGDSITMKKLESEIKNVDAATRSVTKDAFDVEKVLKNINKVSWRDLEKAQRSVITEMKRMERGTAEYAAKEKDLAKITAELNNTRGAMKQNQSVMDKMVSGAKGLLPAFGFAAIAAGAVAAFNKIKNATDTLGTDWDAAVNGMSQGLDTFWRTIATGDWSNFTDRMREAIELGREYIYTLDDIEDRTRSLSVIEAESRKKQLKLEEDLKNVGLSKPERLAAGLERIKIEEELAEKRTSLAQQAFDAEAKVTADQTKLSKERLMKIIRDFDSESKVRAKAYNEQLKQYNQLDRANIVTVGGGNTGGATFKAKQATPEMIKLKATMDAFKDADKVYAEQLRATGNTTDEQLEKMVGSYVKLINAQDSAVENIKKTRTMVNSVMASEKKDDTSSTAKEKKSIADMFAPEKEGDIDMGWITASVKADAEAFAAKKRTADEWTAYLDKKIQEQIDIKNKELEFDKEIAAAQDELKATRIDAVGKIAGALADMFEKGSAAQIAFMAIEKAAAIAQIIFQTGIANAKAVALSPATFGQPWVAINTISAGVSIAGIVAQTIGQVKNSKQSGGFSGSGSDNEVDGIYHKNEFIASAPAVRNPTIKPILDIIDMAQRSGTIRSLNLSAMLQGKQSGGYASPASTSPGSGGAANAFGSGLQNEQLTKMNTLLEKVIDWDPSIAIETYERKRENWKKITNGGLK